MKAVSFVHKVWTRNAKVILNSFICTVFIQKPWLKTSQDDCIAAYVFRAVTQHNDIRHILEQISLRPYEDPGVVWGGWSTPRAGCITPEENLGANFTGFLGLVASPDMCVKCCTHCDWNPDPPRYTYCCIAAACNYSTKNKYINLKLVKSLTEI